MKIIAIIPARSGSKRLPDKNILDLGGHPLMAHTIIPAVASQLFADIIVTSDSDKYLEIAKKYGAIPIKRPMELSQGDITGVEWIEHTLIEMQKQGKEYNVFCILRPTNPFRTAYTLQKACFKFENLSGMNYARTDFSMRAVEKCKQHPCKMWTLYGSKIIPIFGSPEMKLYTQPYHKLSPVLVQNGSLEMGFVETIFDRKSITETVIYPFFTGDYEGFDINNEDDYWTAQFIYEKIKKKETTKLWSRTRSLK